MQHIKCGYDFNNLIHMFEHMTLVYKHDLHFGDTVFVRTLNSLYNIQVWGNNLYSVTGGWFDQNGYSIKKIGIVGCSWGGSAIKTDIIAGQGLCLEFANGVRTSYIVDVSIQRQTSLN